MLRSAPGGIFSAPRGILVWMEFRVRAVPGQAPLVGTCAGQSRQEMYYNTVAELRLKPR
jgi:hypothetical protein